MKPIEIIRGTTPTHIFTVPVGSSQITTLKITYSQNDQVLFSKSKSDVTFDDKQISVTLTQQETLKFVCEPNSPVEIQISIVENNNNVLKSNVMTAVVGKSLLEEVL